MATRLGRYLKGRLRRCGLVGEHLRYSGGVEINENQCVAVWKQGMDTQYKFCQQARRSLKARRTSVATEKIKKIDRSYSKVKSSRTIFNRSRWSNASENRPIHDLSNIITSRYSRRRNVNRTEDAIFTRPVSDSYTPPSSRRNVDSRPVTVAFPATTKCFGYFARTSPPNHWCLLSECCAGNLVNLATFLEGVPNCTSVGALTLRAGLAHVPIGPTSSYLQHSAHNIGKEFRCACLKHLKWVRVYWWPFFLFFGFCKIDSRSEITFFRI